MTTDSAEPPRSGWLASSGDIGAALILFAAAALVVVGAFLLWGPIGLGKRPAQCPGHGGQLRLGPGHDPADGLHCHARQLRRIDGSDRPRHRHVSARILAGTRSQRARRPLQHVRLRRRRPGKVQPRRLRSAALRGGSGLRCRTAREHRDRKPQRPGLVIEMARPSANQCVVVTAIVLRYHVGIRHYTATVPQGEVWACGKLARQPQGS